MRREVPAVESFVSSLRPTFVVAWVDDVALISCGSTLEESTKRAEEALARLLSWTKDYGFIINPSKCCTMTVSPFLRKTAAPSNNLHFGDGDVYIKATCKMRLLGVVFTPDLNWAVHASNAQKSVSKMIGVLNILGSTFNYQTHQRVVKAFVLSKLMYCLPIWGHLECGSRTAMDHTLLRMARVVLGNRAALLDRNTYTATGILPITELAAMKCILVVHLALTRNNCYIPPTLAQHGSHIGMRNITDRRFDVPRHRLSVTEQFLLCCRQALECSSDVINCHIKSNYF